MRRVVIVRGLVLAGAAALVGCLCTPAHAAAPRDAISYLPQISNSTVFTTVDSAGTATEKTQELTSDWQITIAPPVIQIGGANVSWHLFFQTFLQDRQDYALLRSTSPRSNIEEFEFKINNDRLDASSRFWRKDTQTAGSRQTNSDSHQINSTRLKLKLPYYSDIAISDLNQHDYGGEPSLYARGSEQETTNVEFNYQPDKVALTEGLHLTSSKLASNNPISHTRASATSTNLSAQRRLDFGSVGTLMWKIDHNEVTNSTDLGGAGNAGTTITDQQLVSLSNGHWAELPIAYSVDISNASKDPGELPADQSSSRRLVLDFGQQQARTLFSHVRFETQYQESRQPNLGIDVGDLRNQLTWKIRPHPRIDATVIYQQQTTADNVASQLNLDKERIDLNATYKLPGTGGQLSVWKGMENSNSSMDQGSQDVLELTNSVLLGKTASVTFDYKAQRDQSGLIGAKPAATDFLSTGIAYEIRPSTEIYFRGSWYQDLHLRNSPNYRDSNDRVQLEFDYRPQWNWQYQLFIDSAATSTQDLSAEIKQYSNRDLVRASVFFSF